MESPKVLYRGKIYDAAEVAKLSPEQVREKYDLTHTELSAVILLNKCRKVVSGGEVRTRTTK